MPPYENPCMPGCGVAESPGPCGYGVQRPLGLDESGYIPGDKLPWLNGGRIFLCVAGDAMTEGAVEGQPSSTTA